MGSKDILLLYDIWEALIESLAWNEVIDSEGRVFDLNEVPKEAR